MHRAMAGHAVWGIRIAGRGGLPVDALVKLFRFVGVTLRALCRSQPGCSGYFVYIAVTGLAVDIDRAMNAGLRVGSLIGMASRALDFWPVGGMREVLDRGVAVGTAQDSMLAGRMASGTNGNAPAAVGFHSRLAMAAKASFVLL